MNHELSTNKQTAFVSELVENFIKKNRLSKQEGKQLAASICSCHRFEEVLLDLSNKHDIAPSDIADLSIALGPYFNRPINEVENKEQSPATTAQQRFKKSFVVAADGVVKAGSQIAAGFLDALNSEFKSNFHFKEIMNVRKGERSEGDIVIEGIDHAKEEKTINLNLSVMQQPEVALKEKDQLIRERLKCDEWNKLKSALEGQYHFKKMCEEPKDPSKKSGWDSIPLPNITPKRFPMYGDYLYDCECVWFSEETFNKTRFNHSFIEYLRSGDEYDDGICISPEHFFKRWLVFQFPERKYRPQHELIDGIDENTDAQLEADLQDKKETIIAFHEFNRECLSDLYKKYGRLKSNDPDFSTYRNAHFHFDFNSRLDSVGELIEFRGLYSNEKRASCSIGAYSLICKAIQKSLTLDNYTGDTRTTFVQIESSISSVLDEWDLEERFEELDTIRCAPKDHLIRTCLRFFVYAGMIESTGRDYICTDEMGAAWDFDERAMECIEHFRKPHFRDDLKSLEATELDAANLEAAAKLRGEMPF